MYGILEKFPELRPFAGDFRLRMERYYGKREQLLQGHDSLEDFANAHAWYGFHKTIEGWVYREWAPAADGVYLTGDFNGWDWAETNLRSSRKAKITKTWTRGSKNSKKRIGKTERSTRSRSLAARRGTTRTRTFRRSSSGRTRRCIKTSECKRNKIQQKEGENGSGAGRLRFFDTVGSGRVGEDPIIESTLKKERILKKSKGRFIMKTRKGRGFFMKKCVVVFILIGVMCFLFGCNENAMKNVTMLNALSSEKFSEENLENESYAAAYEDFAYSFFKTTAVAERGNNVCLSPFSAYMAFSLCFAGSDGESAEEFKNVFGLTKEQAAAYCRSLYAGLMQRSYNDPKTKVNLANSVWLNKADAAYVKTDYLQTATDSFNAPIFTCDFSDNKTVKAINTWCSDNTDGLIKEIVDRMEEDQFMAIINALLVEAAWVKQYDDSDCVKDDFTDVNGKKEKVTFLKGKTYGYYQAEDAKGFSVSLRDGFSFVGILPNEDVPIGTYCASLTAEKIDTLLSTYVRGYEVTTRIPKLKTDYDVDLKRIMQSMGLSKAFDPAQADFRPMAEFPAGNVYIGTAKQKTHFELDENGIKAAAITYIGMESNAMREPESKIDLFLDRPFVYLLMDTYTGLPLFVGVTNTL